MTSSDLQGGSRVELRQTTPSLDLATLLHLLNAALPAAPGTGLAAQPLFAQHYVENKANYLRVNIAAVIQRLRQPADFQTAFAPGSDSGLLRDAPLPPFGTSARMGGRILQGSEEDCSKKLAALQQAVREELATTLPDYDFTTLAQANMQQLMLKLAESLGFGEKTATAKSVSTPPQSSAKMVAVQFAERLTEIQKDNLARALVGVESMDGGAWPEQFFKGVKQKLDADDADPERNREIINLLREKSEQPGTQMQRFFRFLEEQAMGRVRMQVEMSIMEALASRTPNSKLHDYVARVRELFELFAADAGQALDLEVSSGYGASNNVALHDELRNSTFYYCLPVWCAASAQLLDQVAEDGGAVRRAVSYRFRINGNNPEVGKPAFAARLERIQERLFPESPNTENDTKDLLGSVLN